MFRREEGLLRIPDGFYDLESYTMMLNSMIAAETGKDYYRPLEITLQKHTGKAVVKILASNFEIILYGNPLGFNLSQPDNPNINVPCIILRQARNTQITSDNPIKFKPFKFFVVFRLRNLILVNYYIMNFLTHKQKNVKISFEK